MSNLVVGHPIFSDNSHDASPVLSGGSWESDYPLTNLQDRRLHRVARTVDVTVSNTMMDIDLGVACAVRVVGMPAHNFSAAAKWRARGFAAEPIFEDNDFDSWTDSFSPVVTTGQDDPLGGARATKIEDDDVSNIEQKYSGDVGFTGDGTKAIGITVKYGNATPSGFGIQKLAGAYRLIVRITWAGGVPTLSVQAGSGTLYDPIDLGDGWYFCYANVDNVVAADTNVFRLIPHNDNPGTGYAYFYEALAWDVATEPVLADSGVLDGWPSCEVVDYAWTAPYWNNLGMPNEHVLIAPGNNFATDDAVKVWSTGTLPTPLSASTTYYVKQYGADPDQFELALTPGGSDVDITSAGSGTHYIYAVNPKLVTSLAGDANVGAVHVLDADATARYWRIEIGERPVAM